jgi:hypothetical protein
MTVERALRLMAGTVILLSMALAHFVSPKWNFLTAFAGLNLFQSAFTNWCPAMMIVRKLGLKEAGCSVAETSATRREFPAPDRGFTL